VDTANGRVLLITGASSGIGRVTAESAVRQGWRVVLAARRLSALHELSEELGGPGAALPVACDVNDWEQQQAAVQAGLDAYGRLDAVLANAGFGAPRGFLESTPEHWRDMVLTNVYGCALTIRAALPHILAAQGHVVLTSSTAGRRVLPGSLYSCTKWAVTAMGEALRQEVAEHGVRVTLIEPGMTDTPFFDNAVPDWSLQPADIARAVLYALEQPAHVNVSEMLIRPTGQVL
jgi:NADP-dependent 3-hydroxy acid dehydrogenase YdfG